MTIYLKNGFDAAYNELKELQVKKSKLLNYGLTNSAPIELLDTKIESLSKSFNQLGYALPELESSIANNFIHSRNVDSLHNTSNNELTSMQNWGSSNIMQQQEPRYLHQKPAFAPGGIYAPTEGSLYHNIMMKQANSHQLKQNSRGKFAAPYYSKRFYSLSKTMGGFKMNCGPRLSFHLNNQNTAGKNQIVEVYVTTQPLDASGQPINVIGALFPSESSMVSSRKINYNSSITVTHNSPLVTPKDGLEAGSYLHTVLFKVRFPAKPMGKPKKNPAKELARNLNSINVNVNTTGTY